MRRLTDLQAHLLQGRQMTSLLARGESDKLGFLPYRTETTNMRFILRLCFLHPKLLVANVFHQGPYLVIALGRFFRAPLSEDESDVLFDF